LTLKKFKKSVSAGWMISLFSRRCLVFGNCAPLTPALFPGERESTQIIARFTKEHLANPAHDFSKRQETIPLFLRERAGVRGKGAHFLRGHTIN
jgi:hypothetical protein